MVQMDKLFIKQLKLGAWLGGRIPLSKSQNFHQSQGFGAEGWRGI